MSSNAVFRKGPDGRWITGDDEKTIRLRNIFRAADREGMGAISAHQLLLFLQHRNNAIAQEFGPQDTNNLLDVFTALDADGTGAVTEEQFLERAHMAFRPVEAGAPTVDPTVLTPVAAASTDVPVPPPMTRELLYRSLFNEIDTTNKGFVTLQDIVRVLGERRSRVTEVFGEQDARHALSVFRRLDHSGEGRVTWPQFFECAEIAFTRHVTSRPQETERGEPLPPTSAAPHPPPMTRELLYRSVFSEVDHDNQGTISQAKLVRAMRNHRSSIALVFGARGADHALAAFQRMDVEGDGQLNFDQFYDTCEDAFYEPDEDEKEEEQNDPAVLHPAAAPVGGVAGEVPPVPPMTRELLYRSVYDSIDTRKRGYISQRDLIAAISGPRRQNIVNVFGVEDTNAAISAFQHMDENGDGRVSWTAFFDKAEEAFVHIPAQRQAAPHRGSLALQPASTGNGTYVEPPPLEQLTEQQEQAAEQRRASVQRMEDEMM